MKFFRLLVGSFYSADVYKEVRKEASFCMGYSLLLVLLCTLITAFYYGQVFHREVFGAREGKAPFFDAMVQQIADQLPLMTYSEQKLVTQTPEATVITLSGELFGETFQGFELATIDTTGKTTHDNVQTPILITTNEVIFKGDKETKIKSLSEFTKEAPGTLVINRALAQEMASQLNAWFHKSLPLIYFFFGGILWLIFALFAYVMRVLLLLLLGVAGLAMGAILKSPLEYGAAVSLAAVSFTPMALLQTVLTMAGQHVSIWVVVFAGVVALFFAVRASHSPAQPVAPAV